MSTSCCPDVAIVKKLMAEAAAFSGSTQESLFDLCSEMTTVSVYEVDTFAVVNDMF